MENSSLEKCVYPSRETSIWFVRLCRILSRQLIMGLEYAAAFFLLAGNLRDAVNVCVHQLQDLQLAIAIARVYEGDNGLVLSTLLEDKVLPQAAFEGNRWLASWAFWMLGRRDMAVRVLIVRHRSIVEGGDTKASLSRQSIHCLIRPRHQIFKRNRISQMTRP